MHLPKDGVEYARVTITNLPEDIPTVVEASLDRENWYAVEEVDDELVFLLRGPSAAGTTGRKVFHTNTDLWVRITGLPEVIVRKAGTIYLT